MGELLATLRDNFTDNSISTSAWVESETGSATAAETGGQIRFTLPSSTAGTHSARLTSRYTYDLTSGNFFINIETMVATGVAATAFFQLYLNGTNAIQWIQLSNSLTARHIVAGVTTTVYTVTWSASTYKYLRIRADTTTVYWDSSTNGTSWTNRASVALSSLFGITDLFVDFGASCGNIASPGSFRLDDVNQILPALATTWRWVQTRRALTNRYKRVTLAIDTAGTAQGYLVTADGVDVSDAPSESVRYWSGPAGGGRLLTEHTTEAAAQAQAVDLPVNGSFDLPEMIECRVVRLGLRSTDGNSVILYEDYPRRLAQSDDVEAESIRTINLAASSVTVDKLDAVLTITGRNIQTGYNGARVVMSGDTFGGLVTYEATDTYNTETGSGTYQILLSLADGKFYGGDGNVIIDDDGITIIGDDFTWDLSNISPVILPRPNRIQWTEATASQPAAIMGSDDGQALILGDRITLAIPITSTVSYGLDLNLVGSHRMSADQFTIDFGGSTGPRALTVQTAALDGGLTTVHGGLNVGAPSSTAGTGQIRTEGGIVSEFGGVTSLGTNAGLTFEDRTSAQDWQWYGTSAIARLYNGTGDRFTVEDSGLTSVLLNSSTTNTAPRALQIFHATSGTAAASFGVSISLNGEASAGTSREMALIQAIYTDATDTTRNTDLRLFAADGNGATNNLREGFRVGSTAANVAGIGFFATGVAAKQTVTGSRAANAALASLLTALATYGLITDSSS